MLIEYTKVISTLIVWGLGQQNKIFCYVKIFEGGGVRGKGGGIFGTLTKPHKEKLGMTYFSKRIFEGSLFLMDKDIISFA